MLRTSTGGALVKFVFGNPERYINLDKLDHYRKYTPVLKEIREKQGEQSLALLNENLKDVMATTVRGEEHLRRPIRFIRIVELQEWEKSEVTTFVEESTALASRLTLKTPQRKLEVFKHEVQALELHQVEQLRNNGYAFSKPFKKSEFFSQSVAKFTEGVHSNSIEVLQSLIEYSKCCEFLTSFGMDNKIAITIGAKLFISIYGILKQPGNLTYFLCSVKSAWWWAEHAFLTNCVRLVDNYKYTLATVVTVGTGCSFWWWGAFKGGKAASTVVVAPPTALEAALPKNELAKNFYLKGLRWSKDFAYLTAHYVAEIGNTVWSRMVGERIMDLWDFYQNVPKPKK